MGIYLCGDRENTVAMATRYEKIRGSNHSVGKINITSPRPYVLLRLTNVRTLRS